MSRAVVGIDPGITGAMAVLFDGKLCKVIDMPVDDGRVSGATVSTILTNVANSADDVFVVIEDTQPMPKNGSISSFKLGLNTGICIGVVQSLSLPLRRVRPSEWKRNQGLIGKDKSASRGLASELWPSHAADFRLVKHDGRAEAALIARYGLTKLIQEGHSDDRNLA